MCQGELGISPEDWLIWIPKLSPPAGGRSGEEFNNKTRKDLASPVRDLVWCGMKNLLEIEILCGFSSEWKVFFSRGNRQQFWLIWLTLWISKSSWYRGEGSAWMVSRFSGILSAESETRGKVSISSRLMLLWSFTLQLLTILASICSSNFLGLRNFSHQNFFSSGWTRIHPL